MKARFPKFDFSQVKAHWAPSAEFSQMFNASSLIPAYVEPYLLKVMRMAAGKIDPSDTKLLEEIDIFCKQEMQHCKYHIAYNKVIRGQGYEGLKPLEDKIAAEYDDWLKNRSLRFHLSYCEGFESMSATACEAWFESFDDLVDGADPAVLDMWRWHLAEEFEHRTVCSDAYHALSGLNPVSRYFYRVYGYIYAMAHLGKFAGAATKYLLEQDRAKMTPEEVAASIARQKAVKKRVTKGILPMMLKIMSPFYDPAKRRDPVGSREFLEEFEQRRAALAA
ncbi:MAG TPA: metal-dependent hydrolase [Novosphingobium sp.]|jgi:predicted metal-dependent hydrolase|nr:metal-dependent hydrolase [Novosphingobium sp.]